MKIRRRLFNKQNNKVKEIIEKVELIKKNDKSVIVKLKNGDVIKRKLKDVVEE